MAAEPQQGLPPSHVGKVKNPHPDCVSGWGFCFGSARAMLGAEYWAAMRAWCVD
ncbi:hypothetical protein J43TS9_33620 [Paenibacillus cineris]|nr:hypothetical protein J43TS9_33620 [Paenibacillus cineris]